MAAEQRRLLEQLMGEGLMSGPGSRAPQLSITDPKVCRSFLVGTCPHDLFTNTKQDFGPCPKQHSEALKAEFENADPDQKRRWGFEYDYMRDMEKYVSECNRRIDSAQRRLEKTPDEIRQTNVLLKQIGDLEASIQAGLKEVALLGELEQVHQAYNLYLQIQQYKATKSDREGELKSLSDTSGPSGHQKLQVCDVCGAYLSRLDNDRRLADHFYGKMHLGYAQMRKTYDELKEQLKGRAPPARHDDSSDGFDRGYGGRGGFRGGRGGYRGSRGGFGGPRW